LAARVESNAARDIGNDQAGGEVEYNLCQHDGFEVAGSK